MFGAIPRINNTYFIMAILCSVLNLGRRIKSLGYYPSYVLDNHPSIDIVRQTQETKSYLKHPRIDVFSYFTNW